MIDINISLSDNNGPTLTYVLCLPEASQESLKAVKQLTQTYVMDLDEEISEESRGTMQTSYSQKSGSTSELEDTKESIFTVANSIHEKRRKEFQAFKQAVDGLKNSTPFNLIGK